MTMITNLSEKYLKLKLLKVHCSSYAMCARVPHIRIGSHIHNVRGQRIFMNEMDKRMGFC